MFLILLSVGCTGTGSHFSPITQGNNQAGETPFRKRMLIIAKTYEEQGYNQRAIAAYRQVLKQYPRTEQGRFAKQRILALKQDGKSKKSIASPDNVMLADASASDKQTEKVAKPAKQVSEKPLGDLSLPLPEVVALPEVEKAVEDADHDETEKLSVKKERLAQKEIKDADWPEWSDDRALSDVPSGESNSVTAVTQNDDQELTHEQTVLPSIFPADSPSEKKVHKEEVLLPPAVAFSSEEETGSASESEETDWSSIAGERKQAASPDHLNHEAGENVEGWVASEKSPQSVAATESEQEAAALKESAPEMEDQQQVNRRLASLAYLVGNEKSVPQEVFGSLELLLDHEDEHVRINSAEALFRHQRGNEKALQVISSAFSSPDESIRFIAAHALASAYEQDPENTIKIMEEQLDQESVSVQRQVALLLGGFRDHSSRLITRLQKLADEHPSEEVREAALLSIICLKD